MKCIAKKCEDCKLFISWDMTDEKTGLRKQIKACAIITLAAEIPKFRGSIDGLQSGVNEARNRSIQARDRIDDLGTASVQVLNAIDKKFQKLL